MEIKKYIEENQDRFLDELFDLIRIPSISAEPEHKEDMYTCANKWKEYLLSAGCDKAEIFETPGNPIAYGEKIVDSSKPTILVYGHMDVMPVEPVEQWNTDPFEPVIKDGKIWARGADDDKGQSFIHAKAFEYLVKSDRLKCNVKFMIEGEEEVGSKHLGQFCKDHKEMLNADIILISDTSMLGADVPSITTGLKGLAYWEIEVTGPNVDLHSGLYGGSVANPINELCKIIAQIKDENHHITIPGFYDHVVELSEEERAKIAQAPFDNEHFKQSLEVEELQGEKGYSTLERIGIRPTFDVCGIWGGYTKEGSKTIIPSKAYAKISSRLVANQKYQEISDLVAKHIESIAPKSVSVKVTPMHGGEAYECPITLDAYKAAEKAYEKCFNKMPIPTKSGGSIPIVSTFEEILGIKTLLMGFGLKSDAIHSPNENFPVECFLKGIETVTYFYDFYSEINE